MILSLALLLTVGAEPDNSGFRHGEWRGGCFRDGSLDGMDHELCRASIWIENLGLGAQIERDANGLTLKHWNGECSVSFDDAHMAVDEFAGGDRATKVTAFVQQQLNLELKACKPAATVLIDEVDIAGVLHDSDGLQAGSFVPLDAAARAPAAAVCGRDLERNWRQAIKAYPGPDGAEVRLMMYTFSEKGPDRAKRRFDAMPTMMQYVSWFGMGPGGRVVTAKKLAQPWRNAPAEWFVSVCDIGIETWSSFVELGLYDSTRDPSPKFTARASTGVAGPKGYAIRSGGGQ